MVGGACSVAGLSEKTINCRPRHAVEGRRRGGADCLCVAGVVAHLRRL
jgi:hypothetical protein